MFALIVLLWALEIGPVKVTWSAWRYLFIGGLDGVRGHTEPFLPSVVTNSVEQSLLKSQWSLLVKEFPPPPFVEAER